MYFIWNEHGADEDGGRCVEDSWGRLERTGSGEGGFPGGEAESGIAAA